MPPHAPGIPDTSSAKPRPQNVLNVIPFDRVLQADRQFFLRRFLLLDPGRRVQLEAGVEYSCYGGISIPIIPHSNHGRLPGLPAKTVVVQCHPAEDPRLGPILILVREERLAMPVVSHPDSDFVGTPETTEWFSHPSLFQHRGPYSEMTVSASVPTTKVGKGGVNEELEDRKYAVDLTSFSSAHSLLSRPLLGEPTTELMNMKQLEVSDDMEDDKTEYPATWPPYELQRIGTRYTE
ncbi:hypothetical protein FB451DRAFT_1196864 [Mycena latifolia]|nr:hypothetical protein FB451DRAFT_1196864 [Mycena latifolia]